MADEDRLVSDHYRALPREEPQAALDAAITAAARRALAPRTRAWRLPLALAAVIVLSVTVTLQVQRERPDLESVGPVARSPGQVSKLAESTPVPERSSPAPAVAAGPLAAQVPATAPAIASRTAPDAAPPVADKRKVLAEKKEALAREQERGATAGAAPSFAPDPDARRRDAPAAPAAEDRIASNAESDTARASAARQASGAAAPVEPALARRDALGAASPAPQAVEAARDARAKRAESAAAPAARVPLAKADTPERWLERIAEMRSLGQDREADEALAAFRKQHPDYVIPRPMLERVQPR